VSVSTAGLTILQVRSKCCLTQWVPRPGRGRARQHARLRAGAPGSENSIQPSNPQLDPIHKLDLCCGLVHVFSHLHHLNNNEASLGWIPSAHGDARLACRQRLASNPAPVPSSDPIAHQITTHGLVASFSSCTAAVLAASAPSPSPPRTCRCLAAKLPSMFRSRLQPLNVVTCVRARPASVRVRMTGSVQAQDDLLEA